MDYTAISSRKKIIPNLVKNLLFRNGFYLFLKFIIKTMPDCIYSDLKIVGEKINNRRATNSQVSRAKRRPKVLNTGLEGNR
ncbi:MAG TPA: hypothetical protein DC049_03150 [Spirochaetia bacterium]|nr:hypothetical protein [Spirochaetia bacterium]